MGHGRGRHAVDRIVRWRGKGASREAELEWEGFDLADGARWRPTWVPKRQLTADLRAQDPLKRKRVGCFMSSVMHRHVWRVMCI